eukprot:PhF_6_TR11022/c0_g1_i1/m.17851
MISFDKIVSTLTSEQLESLHDDIASVRRALSKTLLAPPVSRLPPELNATIFSFLEIKDVMLVSMTCRRWRRDVERNPQLLQTMQHKLLVLGGSNDQKHLTTFHTYSVAKNRWDTVHDSHLPSVKGPFAAVHLKARKRLYVVGGIVSGTPLRACDSFDLVKKSWTHHTPMSTARSKPAVVCVDDCIYVFGGFNGVCSSNSVEKYDVATDTWSSCAPMIQSRGAPCACAIQDGRMLVAGGWSGDLDNRTSLSTMEIFDPITNTWTAGPAMSTRRSTPSAVWFDESVYVLGGYDSVTHAWLGSVERFDVKKNEWFPCPRMLTPRSGHGVAVAQNSIFCVGGWNGTDYFSNVEKFDGETNRWVVLKAMPTRRRDASVFFLTADDFEAPSSRRPSLASE